MREQRYRLNVNRFVWRLHADSGRSMAASLDPAISDGLRSFNHAKALETSRIAKELDLLVLDGAVAHEMFVLSGKQLIKKQENENGSENKATG